jgi:hypothetical protein
VRESDRKRHTTQHNTTQHNTACMNRAYQCMSPDQWLLRMQLSRLRGRHCVGSCGGSRRLESSGPRLDSHSRLATEVSGQPRQNNVRRYTTFDTVIRPCHVVFHRLSTIKRCMQVQISTLVLSTGRECSWVACPLCFALESLAFATSSAAAAATADVTCAGAGASSLSSIQRTADSRDSTSR